MHHPLRVIFALLLAAISASACSPKPTFTSLDLSHWTPVNVAPGTFTARNDPADGPLIHCTGTPTGLLRSNRPYQNFVLELEWRHLNPQGNAGLFICSDPLPGVGSPFTRAIEVQVMNGPDGDWYTCQGDVFPIQGASMTALTGKNAGKNGRAFPTANHTKPSPEWNHYRVECNKGDITLAVNGHVVTKGTAASPAKGYICLESEGTPIDFRNIKITELPAPEPVPDTPLLLYRPEGFTPLFNGLDFDNWKHESAHADHWKAIDGKIVFDGQGTHLWSTKSYKNFVLIADWRWTAKPKEAQRPSIKPDGSVEKTTDGQDVSETVLDAGDSGIYLRGNDKSQVNMWCWPIGSGEVYGYRTDSKMSPEIRASVTPKSKADKPIGQWNRFEIIMKGEQLTVILNGVSVIQNATLPGIPAEGPIALQQHGDPIEFTNILIKELP